MVVPGGKIKRDESEHDGCENRDNHCDGGEHMGGYDTTCAHVWDESFSLTNIACSDTV